MKLDFPDLDSTSVWGMMGSVFLWVLSRVVPILIKNPTILAKWHASIFAKKDKKLLMYMRSLQALYKPELHGVLDRNLSNDLFPVLDLGDDRRLTNVCKFIEFNKLVGTREELLEKGVLIYDTVSINDELKTAFYSGNNVGKQKFFVVSLYAFAIYRREGLMQEINKSKVRSVYIIAFERGTILTQEEIDDISNKVNSYVYNFQLD